MHICEYKSISVRQSGGSLRANSDIGTYNIRDFNLYNKEEETKNIIIAST